MIDITDFLDVPERDEAIFRVKLINQFELLVKSGQLILAAKLLEESCQKPHIYHGHYKKLFMIWRKLNKQDLALHNYQVVIERVKKTIKLNNEMLNEMSLYWSKVHGVPRSKSYFAKYSHIKITDLKALLESAKALSDMNSLELAESLLKDFPSRINS